MTTLVAKQQLTELWDTPKTVYGWLATVDHKDLGIRYLVTAFVLKRCCVRRCTTSSSRCTASP
jgi:hypothetical protein